MPDALVVLDDAAHPAEKEAIERWVRAGAFLVERRRWERGIAVLRLDAPDR